MTSETTAGRCVSCRNWGEPEWWTYKEWEFGDKARLCGALADDNKNRSLAWPIQRSESMTGDLATMPNFGCVLWEAADAKA
jgi:hypothetical protein